MRSDLDFTNEQVQEALAKMEAVYEKYLPQGKRLTGDLETEMTRQIEEIQTVIVGADRQAAFDQFLVPLLIARLQLKQRREGERPKG